MLAHVSTFSGPISTDALSTALVGFVWGVAALVVVAVLASRAGRLRDTTVPFARWSAAVAAGSSLGAAAVHFAVIGEHFAEYPPYGIAFVALAWFQVGWAVAHLISPGRSLALSGVVVNAAALLIWAASRTVGLPIGPEDGHIEPVGALDLAASGMEATLVVLLLWERGVVSRTLRPALPGAGAVVVIGSTALAVVLLTTTAFAAAGSDPHGNASHPPELGAVTSPSPGSSGLLQEATAATGPDPSGRATPTTSSPAPVEGPSSPSLPADASPTGTSTASVGPTAAPSGPAPPSQARPTAAPTATPIRPTPVPATPQPRPTEPPVSVAAGQIRFGTGIDQDGDLVGLTSQFEEGQHAAWIAEFREAPAAPAVTMLIVQVLDDGREFEHWREDFAVADPAATRFVGGAVLSVYLHAGAGNYRLRYVRGDALLAEGAFRFVP